MTFDKHIPAPQVAHPKFREMEVGDSVFIPHEGNTLSCQAYKYAATIQKRAKGKFKFVGRRVTEDGVNGIRIWRVPV